MYTRLASAGNKETTMNAWTYRITNNGREVENLDAGTYATEAEARQAGEAALDDCCPPGSKNRSAYRLEVYAVRAAARD